MARENVQINIVPATETEREWGAQLLASSEPWITLNVSLQTCRNNCNDPSYEVFIAQQDGKPAGIIIIHPKGVAGSPYIKTIAVDTSFKNMGIGRSLMQFAEEHAAKTSPHLFLCVSSFNTAAQNFYHQLGYSKVGAFEDYIIKGALEILLYKRLA